MIPRWAAWLPFRLTRCPRPGFSPFFLSFFPRVPSFPPAIDPCTAALQSLCRDRPINPRCGAARTIPWRAFIVSSFPRAVRGLLAPSPIVHSTLRAESGVRHFLSPPSRIGGVGPLCLLSPDAPQLFTRANFARVSRMALSLGTGPSLSLAPSFF